MGNSWRVMDLRGACRPDRIFYKFYDLCNYINAYVSPADRRHLFIWSVKTGVRIYEDTCSAIEDVTD